MRNEQHKGAVAIDPDGRVVIERNLVLESIWKIYDPQREWGWWIIMGPTDIMLESK